MMSCVVAYEAGDLELLREWGGSANTLRTSAARTAPRGPTRSAASGWLDVQNGDIQKGLKEIQEGLGEGSLPPGLVGSLVNDSYLTVRSWPGPASARWNSSTRASWPPLRAGRSP